MEETALGAHIYVADGSPKSGWKRPLYKVDTELRVTTPPEERDYYLSTLRYDTSEPRPRPRVSRPSALTRPGQNGSSPLPTARYDQR
jgi:hypothetical protein